MPTHRSHSYPGTLIVLEGITRAGKTTTIRRIEEALAPTGTPLTVASWNSFPDLEPAIYEIKHRNELDGHGLFFSLLADLWLTQINVVRPALERGEVVLHDRYTYTSAVRARLRGVPDSLLDACHAPFTEPDAVVFLDLDPDTAWERFFATRGSSYDDYAYGLDIWPDETQEGAFKKYVARQRIEYEREIPTAKRVSAEDLPDFVLAASQRQQGAGSAGR